MAEKIFYLEVEDLYDQSSTKIYILKASSLLNKLINGDLNEDDILGKEEDINSEDYKSSMLFVSKFISNFDRTQLIINRNWIEKKVNEITKNGYNEEFESLIVNQRSIWLSVIYLLKADEITTNFVTDLLKMDFETRVSMLIRKLREVVGNSNKIEHFKSFMNFAKNFFTNSSSCEQDYQPYFSLEGGYPNLDIQSDYEEDKGIISFPVYNEIENEILGEERNLFNYIDGADNTARIRNKLIEMYCSVSFHSKLNFFENIGLFFFKVFSDSEEEEKKKFLKEISNGVNARCNFELKVFKDYLITRFLPIYSYCSFINELSAVDYEKIEINSKKYTEIADAFLWESSLEGYYLIVLSEKNLALNESVRFKDHNFDKDGLFDTITEPYEVGIKYSNLLTQGTEPKKLKTKSLNNFRDLRYAVCSILGGFKNSKIFPISSIETENTTYDQCFHSDDEHYLKEYIQLQWPIRNPDDIIEDDYSYYSLLFKEILDEAKVTQAFEKKCNNEFNKLMNKDYCGCQVLIKDLDIDFSTKDISFNDLGCSSNNGNLIELDPNLATDAIFNKETLIFSEEVLKELETRFKKFINAEIDDSIIGETSEKILEIKKNLVDQLKDVIEDLDSATNRDGIANRLKYFICRDFLKLYLAYIESDNVESLISPQEDPSEENLIQINSIPLSNETLEVYFQSRFLFHLFYRNKGFLDDINAMYNAEKDLFIKAGEKFGLTFPDLEIK